MRRAGIAALGAYAPAHILSNAALERLVDTTDQWITSRTGIKERRIAASDEASSDLAVQAVRDLARRFPQFDPGALDLILCATATPDTLFPATASLVQHRVSATRAAACDIGAGCTGFVYALALASGMVQAGSAQQVLVLGAETLSRIVDWQDRATCVLFGDGAGAALVAPVERGGFLSFVLGSDGSGASDLCLPAGGSRQPASPHTLQERLHYLRMNGREVFKFAVPALEQSTRQALSHAGLALPDLDLLVPHQANVRILQAAADRLGLPMERVVVNVERYGNTSSASIPLALVEALDQGRLKSGQRAVLAGFGAGLTWGAALVEWSW
ncbi:MAG: ketoacyl-ACP synthase III [Deinococcus sp.]|nr:ketoacyl-ACP synthase III [Deinococcus sp.]